MKNTFLRILALLLVMSMLLTGCGKGNVAEDNPPADTNTPVSDEQAPESGAKPYWEMLDEVSDTSELPDWEGDTLEITMWVAAGTDPNLGEIPETDVAFKELERVTGIKYNIEESYGNGGNSVDAKLPMVLASNDLPHIMLGYGIEPQLRELYEEGYLADLTEYYKDGTLDQLTEVMPLEETWDYAYAYYSTEEGNIYAIPSSMVTSYSVVQQIWSAAGISPDGYDPAHFATYGTYPVTWSGVNNGTTIMVRDDILQAVRPDALTAAEIKDLYVQNGGFTSEEIFDLGLKSADDFWQLLRDIKAEIDKNEYLDANGNKAEIMAGADTEEDNWRYSVDLCGALYQCPPNTDYFCVADYTPADEDSLLQWGYKSDFYLNHWKMMNQMVNEDIISANSFVDNKAGFMEKRDAGHYLVTYGGLYSASHGGYDYRPIWIDGAYNTQETGGFATAQYIYEFGIFKDSFTDEQLDQFMHAINYLNSEVGVKNFVWGPASAGLFEEDAEGNRSYTDVELYEDMVLHTGNGAAMKYGLYNAYGGEYMGDVWFPTGLRMVIEEPNYVYADRQEISADNAFKFYNPGTLPGKSQGENAMFLTSLPQVFGWGMQFDYIQTFWAARAGFENQIKKMIVAESDAEFQKQYEELLAFTEANGLTDEALADYNAAFVEANRDALVANGILD